MGGKRSTAVTSDLVGQDTCGSCINDKKSYRRIVVSLTRGTEVKEKGEGSLSIPIVPFETRETMAGRSRGVGKGKSRAKTGRMPVVRTVV